MKALLSLTLMVVQLLSWSPAPMYLCLGCDRSVCIHFAEVCHCCEDAQPCASCGESDLVCCPCHSHHEDAEVRAWRVERMDAEKHACECTHLLISLPGRPVVVKSIVALDEQQPELGLVVPRMLSCCWLTAMSRDRHRLLAGLSPHLGLSSIGLDSVVLRC